MKTNPDIEQLLVNEKNLTLSADEKNSIKSTLLAHATETLRHEKRSSVPLWRSWLLPGTVSLASLLVAFVGTAYAAQDSLPGEPLYAIKVHVVEEMIALTKTDPRERIAYDSGLMETRLSELQALTTQEEAPSPDALALVTDQIKEHVQDVTDTLATTEHTQLSHTDRVEALSKITSLAKAQAKISRTESDLKAITDDLQEVEDGATQALNTGVQDFASATSTEALNDYLSDQITAVGDQIHASSTAEAARDQAENHLHDVDESLTDGDTTAALISVFEAQQSITTELYLKKSNDQATGGGENVEGTNGSQTADGL